MNELDALKAAIINAAEIAGIDDRVGSLKEGKDVDIAIFDHLEFLCKIAAYL